MSSASARRKKRQGHGGTGGAGSSSGGGGGGQGGGGPGKGKGKEKETPSETAEEPSSRPVTASEVKALEDQYSTETKPLQKGTAPLRPAFVGIGLEQPLQANYMPVMLDETKSIFVYTIQFITDSNSPPAGLCRRLIQLLLEDPRFEMYSSLMATDWRHILLVATKLPENLVDSELPLKDTRAPQNTPQGPDRRKMMAVKLDFTKSVSVVELNNYVNMLMLADTNISSDKYNVIQYLNIILNHKAKSNTHRLSKPGNINFPLVDHRDSESLGGGKEALRGYLTSFRLATGRSLLNIQVKHAAVWTSGPLEEALGHLQGGQGYATAHRTLKGVKVRLTHLGTQVERTIFGLATMRDGKPTPKDLSDKKPIPEKPPLVQKDYATPGQLRFWLAGTSGAPGQADKYVTVAQYFQTAYNKSFANSQWPVVNVGSQLKPTYVPAECCQVAPGQPVRGMISPSESSKMIDWSVNPPDINRNKILQSGLATNLLDENNEALNAFGLKIHKGLVTVPARKLNPPEVKYAGNDKLKPQDGTWNMKDRKLLRGVPVERWAVIIFTGGKGSQKPMNIDQKSIVANLVAVWQAAGVKVGTANLAVVQETLSADTSPGSQAVHVAVHQAFDKVSSQLNQKIPQVILVVLPNDDKALYNRIKYVGECERGWITQCCVSSKLLKFDKTYLANVVLKINAKLNGQNHEIAPEFLGPVKTGDTMLVGIDVTHPSPGSTSTAPSIAAIVASVDKQLGRWPATIKTQLQRKEMVTEVGEMFKTRLDLWKNLNKKFPKNIVIYRDGVSEGQYDQVMDEEFAPIRKACEETYPATDTKSRIPRISMIVVGKRHHTRFYPTAGTQYKGKNDNPPCGTLVDRAITYARTWDFFLQAHAAIKGTARPAHYIVLHDEVFRGHNMDQVERLRNISSSADLVADFTHNISYLWSRATKSVSVCPPAYYADIACERARRYLADVFEPEGAPEQSDAGSTSEHTNTFKIHASIQDKMFYL